MAILNVKLEPQNLTPTNGSYVFMAQFLDDTTGQILDDPRFPQNQILSVTSIPSTLYFPLEIADGNYSLANVRVKITYKSQVLEAKLNQVVDCIKGCVGLPIVSITTVSATTYKVRLTSADNNTYNWRVFNSANQVLSNDVVVVSSEEFNIEIGAVASGDYVLELTGSTCRDKAITAFPVVASSNPCTFGPNLLSIVSNTQTSLKFSFDALSVFGISWRIKQGTDILRNGVVKHTSIAQPGEPSFSDNQPTVNFTTLPNGTYQFEIEGSTCTSAVSVQKSFTVSGQVTPLAFVTNSPSVTGTGANHSMSIEMTVAGTYNTTILNTTTGVYYQQGNVTYTLGTPFVKTGLPTGNYTVQVSTVQASLVIADSSTVACTVAGRNPILTSVSGVTSSSLSFNFDADKVFAIAWRIKKSGVLQRSGVVYPTNANPSITFDTLSDGNYTLEIEGYSCNSPVSGPISFTIAPVVVGGNGGIYTQTVNGKYYGYTQGKDFRVAINSTTGGVKLIYNDIVKSLANDNNVKAMLLNKHMAEVKPSELAALKGDGLVGLPDGSHDYFLYYFDPTKVTTLAQVIANYWLVAGEPGQAVKYFYRMEKVTIEIKTNLTL